MIGFMGVAIKPFSRYYAGKKVGQAFQPNVSGKSGWKA